MESRKRVNSYEDNGPGKRHHGEDHGHLSRQRADSRSMSPQGAPPRSRSMSPNGHPPPQHRFPRGSPRGGPPRERSFSPGPQGNGEGGRTKICHFWRETDSCKFGSQCHFAHSLSGIRGRVSPSPMDGPPPHIRKQFHQDGRNGGPPARRGGRHSAERGPPMGRGPMRPRSRSPRGGPPGMRGPTVCHFWKTNDNCKFGDQCKFLHSFPEPGEFARGPPPRRDFPPPGRPGRRSFSPPRQNYPPRGPRISPGRDGGRPIVWNHDVSPRQQRYDYDPHRGPSPRRERSITPRRYDRGPSPRIQFNIHQGFPRYMSPPPPQRGMSPGRYHSPPRRMSPRFERGRSPPPRHGSPPRGRRDHFSPPTQYRGQPGPRRGGGEGGRGGRGGGGGGPKREICYFFTQKQGCRNAENCNFIHAKPGEGAPMPERPERSDRPPRRERPPRGEGSPSGSRDSSPA